MYMTNLYRIQDILLQLIDIEISTIELLNGGGIIDIHDDYTAYSSKYVVILEDKNNNMYINDSSSHVGDLLGKDSSIFTIIIGDKYYKASFTKCVAEEEIETVNKRLSEYREMLSIIEDMMPKAILM